MSYLSKLYEKQTKDKQLLAQKVIERRHMYLQMLDEEKRRIGYAEYERLRGVAGDIGPLNKKDMYEVLVDQKDIHKRTQNLRKSVLIYRGKVATKKDW